jgi:two-component system response regulator MprA
MAPHDFHLTDASPAPNSVLLCTEIAPLVLIVDDDQSVRDLLAAGFQREGYRVSRATDGIEALEKAQHLHPSVILMDLFLPRYDGCAAARRLKTDTRTSDIPIVALTGDEREETPRRAWEAGCAAFFTKPAEFDDLVQCVRGLIRWTTD